MVKKFISLLAIVLMFSCTETTEPLCDCEQYNTQAKGNGQIEICHEGVTIFIDENSWPEHEAHGDIQGNCDALGVEDLDYDPCRTYCLDK